ncbi:hypothetical protein PHMEG_00017613 [Phytophthora megakarya]|uniref:Uncharacterized protein n=1 Tax=Phytophthora megakarya TaxID=4795 RepID=A0A225VWW4_9STRA|nr:hypothetical protein PHMEG_00017613 [Phytophthora megakarya]
MVSSGYVAKSLSGKSDKPCSSDFLRRTKRTKKTSSAPIDKSVLRRCFRSEARSKRYQSKHK